MLLQPHFLITYLKKTTKHNFRMNSVINILL